MLRLFLRIDGWGLGGGGKTTLVEKNQIVEERKDEPKLKEWLDWCEPGDVFCVLGDERVAYVQLGDVTMGGG